jgi:hypothetical protein
MQTNSAYRESFDFLECLAGYSPSEQNLPIFVTRIFDVIITRKLEEISANLVPFNFPEMLTLITKAYISSQIVSHYYLEHSLLHRRAYEGCREGLMSSYQYVFRWLTWLTIDTNNLLHIKKLFQIDKCSYMKLLSCQYISAYAFRSNSKCNVRTLKFLIQLVHYQVRMDSGEIEERLLHNPLSITNPTLQSWALTDGPKVFISQMKLIHSLHGHLIPIVFNIPAYKPKRDLTFLSMLNICSSHLPYYNALQRTKSVKHAKWKGKTLEQCKEKLRMWSYFGNGWEKRGDLESVPVSKG